MIDGNSNKKTFRDALFSLRPNAIWSSKDDDITWTDTEQTQPTQSEIDAEIIRLQAEYDAQEYARKRKAEYPSIQELVVALYDTEDRAAIDTKRAEVKAKYSK